MSTRTEVYAAVDAERNQQRITWDGPHEWGAGDCSSPHVRPEVKVAVLAEECGEVARAVLDRDDAELRRELVQVAAVAVAWLESLTTLTPYPDSLAEPLTPGPDRAT